MSVCLSHICKTFTFRRRLLGIYKLFFKKYFSKSGLALICSSPRSPYLVKVYLTSLLLTNRSLNNEMYGSSSTTSILLQKGISNSVVNPHLPPMINTVFYFF